MNDETTTAPADGDEPVVDQDTMTDADDNGKNVPAEANEEAPVVDVVSKSTAQIAPEPPLDDVQDTKAVEPSVATPAASGADEGRLAEDVVAGQVVSIQPEPDRFSALETDLAAEREKSAALTNANEVLRGQLGLSMESLDQSRAEFEQAESAMRAEITALVDSLHDKVRKFREQAQAVGAVPAGDRVRVFLRQPAVVAGEAKEIGTTLGFVNLSPGVSLNYLVDAVRNGIAKGR